MAILDVIRPKWKSSDADVRLEAVREMDDTETLCRVVIKDSEWFVRHGALARLRELNPDPKCYSKIVRESRDEEVRRKVVKIMDDREELTWVAENDKYRYVRDAAEHRLEELKTNLWGEPKETPAAVDSAPEPEPEPTAAEAPPPSEGASAASESPESHEQR